MMMDGWNIHQQQYGRIQGNRGTDGFNRSIQAIQSDPNVVELTVDRMELEERTVASLRSVFLSRKWKSITLHDTDDSTPQERWDEIISSAMAQTVRLEVRGGVFLPLARSLATGLRARGCCLKKLSLVSSNIALATGVIIGEALSSCSVLEEFALTNCRVNNDVLSALLGLSSRLKALYLCDCYLEEMHLAQLVDALVYHPCLKQLWLNGKQRFGSDASKLLVEGLKTHTELEHIQMPNAGDCCPQMQGYMELNRGGRRLLGFPNTNLALWPLVLERVGRIPRLSHKSRANILYFFIHQLHGREQLR